MRERRENPKRLSEKHGSNPTSYPYVAIGINRNTRNGKLLESFAGYCKQHPEERFWQALRNWSGRNFVFVSDTGPHDLMTFSTTDLEDTFYWEGKSE
jgi:hypothetical protein